ncbi:MAG: deoxyribodipyrimidine photo-lyase [Cypionkella sp.]|nr:deoxyribodipyrimidine photo-lyase [Cypionkella sp.]
MEHAPLLLWFRRDLRLDDHPMVQAALQTGRPLIPVFIYDTQTAALGAAPRWRLGQGVAAFARRLEAMGSRLILRRGDAQACLDEIIAQTGAAGVMWQRLYDPASTARDAAIKANLRAKGLIAESHSGALLIEPWCVQTGQGGPYRVYSPFWRAVAGLDFGPALPAPKHLPAPDVWPASEALDGWRMGADMRRGAAIVAQHACVGEAAALARLDDFIARKIDPYKEARDFVGVDANSGLSENLAWGEIGPRRIWHAADAPLMMGARGAEHFRKELVWREFAYHLMHHFPHILTRNWREEWDGFGWRGDNPQAEAWRRGMTGEPFVDAAMREVYVTGRMHNRARMIVASYLTKHLLTDWRIGADWFADVLTDYDPASNAMGWQWVAGSGPDAAPYFRVFNPAGQAEKFDANGAYRRKWIAEGQGHPSQTALAYFDAVPRRWGLSAQARYPAPIVDLAAGRARALEAYSARGQGATAQNMT